MFSSKFSSGEAVFVVLNLSWPGNGGWSSKLEALMKIEVGVNDPENAPVSRKGPNRPYSRQEGEVVFTETTLFTALEILL